MKRKLPTRLWGGFADGALYDGGLFYDSYGGPVRKFELYINRADARKRWMDVRRVEVREVGRKKERK